MSCLIHTLAHLGINWPSKGEQCLCLGFTGFGGHIYGIWETLVCLVRNSNVFCIENRSLVSVESSVVRSPATKI